MNKYYVLFGLFFLLVSSSIKTIGQTPGGVDTTGYGGAFWLKANSTTGVTLDGTGNFVLSWQDEFSTYDVTATATSNAPEFLDAPSITRDFNFNPSVDFTPSASRALRSNSYFPNFSGSSFTYFFVCNSISGNGSLITYRSPNNIRLQAKPGWRLQNGYLNIGYTSDFGTGGGGPSNADFPGKAARVMTSKGIAANTDVRLNAKSYPINNTSSTYNPAISQGLKLGANNISEYYQDALAELIMFPVELNNGDANKIESYLAMKYGCTLDSGTANSNYILGDSSIIWPSSNHPDYHHRITAIVRDDASGLYQKQSQSVHFESRVGAFFGATNGTFPLTNGLNTSVIANQQYMLFGDNDSSEALNRCIAGGYMAAMERTWIVRQSLNFNNNVTLRVLKDSVAPEVRNLIVSADPSFPITMSTLYPLTDDGTYLYAEALLGDSLFFTFTSDTVITTFTSTPSYCTSNTGTATAVSTEGGGNYSYTWATAPPQMGATATGLGSGPVIVTVSHGNGCTVTDTAAISSATYLLTVSDIITDETCTNANGVIELDANASGTAPYTYSIDGGTNTSPNNIFNGLSAGNYPILVSDANGCTNIVYSATVLNTVTAPDISYTITEPNCFGEPGAGIQIVATSGAQPHTFSITGLGLQNTTGTFSDLYANTYPFRIVDAQNCHLDTNIALTEPSQVDLQADVENSCWLSPTGRVTLNAFGGVPSYEYSYDGIVFDTENLIDNLPVGTSTFYVQDSHGCRDSLDVNITEYPRFEITYDTKDIECTAWNSGTIEVTVKGNTSPYTYSWLEFPGEIIGNIKEDLYPGTYHIEVQDANLCTDTIKVLLLNNCCSPFVPNAFTPNGDGLNDVLEVQKSPDMKIVRFQIFNRFGQEIFYSIDQYPKWDGTYKGQKVEIDNYIWQATVICTGEKEVTTGDITVIR